MHSLLCHTRALNPLWSPTRWRWTILMFLLVGGLGFVVSPGCQSSDSHSKADHDHAHETPPHFPTSVSDAEQRLQEILDRIAQGKSTPTERFQKGHEEAHDHSHDSDSHHHTHHDVFEELAEWVDWLPGVVADSELNEPEWVVAVEVSTEVKGSLRDILNAPSSTRQEHYRERSNQITTALTRLNPVWEVNRQLEAKRQAQNAIFNEAPND